jgi:hypothetical protein
MQILQLSITHKKPFSSTVYRAHLPFLLNDNRAYALQLPNHNPNRTWSLYTTQTSAYMHSPNSQPTHAYNSSYSLPKQTLTLLLIPVNPHRACNSPYSQPKQSLYVYIPPIHNPHMPTTPLIPYPNRPLHSSSLFLWIYAEPATPLTHNPNKTLSTPHTYQQLLLFLTQTDRPLHSSEFLWIHK